MEGLTAGRIVHYVLPDGPNAGEHRPAIVVKVWSGNYVNMVVFMDGTNDGLLPGECTRWETSIEHSSEPKARTWHWIERA